MNLAQVEEDVMRGGRFRVFVWNFSALIVSFRRASPLSYTRSTDVVGAKAWCWSIPSMILGWWGFPWGIIFTITSLYRNCHGGRDLTQEVLSATLGPERAAKAVNQAITKPADPALWLLRVVCLSIPVAIFVLLSYLLSHRDNSTSP